MNQQNLYHPYDEDIIHQCRECLSLHVGQAGCGIGNELWHLYCQEHGVQPNATLSPNTPDNPFFMSFFHEHYPGLFKPLAIFVDAESEAVDKIKRSEYKHFFSSGQYVTENSMPSCTFARGYHIGGKTLIGKTLESIRNIVEGCDQVQGFLICHALGGGTSSGLTSKIVEELESEYKGCCMHDYTLYPGVKMDSSVIEPYNALLSIHSAMDFSGCIFMANNDVLKEICVNKLKLMQPSFSSLNSLVSKVYSLITGTLRYEGYVNTSLSEIQTTLVPFKRARFPLISCSPILSEEEAQKVMNVDKIATDSFKPNSQMMLCDTSKGKMMAACFLFRGKVESKQVKASMTKIKTENLFEFASCCPSVFKIGINYEPSPTIDGFKVNISPKPTLCSLRNTTAISEVWKKLSQKFYLMFQKRAFLHWYYTEGMEENDFNEAYDDIINLQKDYQFIAED